MFPLPIQLDEWLKENRQHLTPPVNNKVIFSGKDFFAMLVGGPNNRSDFHINSGEEFFYQLEGEAKLEIQTKEGKKEEIHIPAGHMYLLPALIPHSPQRAANSLGLVIEKIRAPEDVDGFSWYCRQCNEHLFTKEIPVKDVVGDLPKLFDEIRKDPRLLRCSFCSHQNTI